MWWTLKVIMRSLPMRKLYIASIDFVVHSLLNTTKDFAVHSLLNTATSLVLHPFALFARLEVLSLGVTPALQTRLPSWMAWTLTIQTSPAKL
jgi:hypothetical protein